MLLTSRAARRADSMSKTKNNGTLGRALATNVAQRDRIASKIFQEILCEIRSSKHFKQMSMLIRSIAPVLGIFWYCWYGACRQISDRHPRTFSYSSSIFHSGKTMCSLHSSPVDAVTILMRVKWMFEYNESYGNLCRPHCWRVERRMLTLLTQCLDRASVWSE